MLHIFGIYTQVKLLLKKYNHTSIVCTDASFHGNIKQTLHIKAGKIKSKLSVFLGYNYTKPFLEKKKVTYIIVFIKLFHYLVVRPQLFARPVSMPLACIVTPPSLGCVNTEALTIEPSKRSLLMTS